jgi:proteasome assembly chaperone (PAC2) family protein
VGEHIIYGLAPASSMLETELWLEDGARIVRAEDGVLVEGLPGIGLVAKVAVAYMVKQMKVRRICRIFSPHFPSLGYVTEGRLVFSFADIYLSEGRPPILFLYGNSQPSTSYGQYDFCEKVINFSKEIGCRTVITIGGYGKDHVSERREIYCSSTDPELLEKWMARVDGSTYVGQIVGAAGLLAVLASEAGLRNFSMLVEAAEMTPDFYAARRAIEATNKILELGITVPTVDELSRVYMQSLQELETA